VKLETGEVGLVVESNPHDAFRPHVKIFYDAQDNKLEEPLVVDLTEKDRNGRYARKLLRQVDPFGEGQKYIQELFGPI
jgi:hypothetical protein